MVMPIMTQTLPTVISMGVVSETTRVMFDKKGKRVVKKVRERKVKNYKVHKGARGGSYIIRKGRKIYI